MTGPSGTGVDITSVPLSRADETRLEELELVVEAGLEKFVEVGNALAAIRDGKYFRQTHSTFEAYCRERWNFTDRYARNLIVAAEIGTMVPVQNERQARELVGLPLGQAREAFQTAVADTAGRPTAAAVRAAAEPYRRPAAPARRKPLPDAYRAAVWDLNKSKDRLVRLTEDDRFKASRAGLSGSNLGALNQIIDGLTRVRDELTGGPTLDMDPAEVADILVMGKATDEQFEDALLQARGEDDLTRQNVVQHLTSSAAPAAKAVRPPGPVVIELRAGTALVVEGRSAVTKVLNKLGVQSMPDLATKQMSFPASQVDRVAAAVERAGSTCDVRMASW